MPFLQKLRIILQSKRFIVISLIFIIIYILISTKLIKYESIIDNSTTSLTGKVISYTIDGNKLSMLVKGLEKIEVTYYIKTKEEKLYLNENLLIGELVKLEGSVNEPLKNTIPNTFNYKRYLYNNHIYKTFQADQITLSNKTSLLNQIKSLFIKRINNMGSSKAYLYAFILGETAYIGNDAYQNYQENGTTHLFAVSGMHISLLVLILRNIMKKIHLKENLGNILIIIFLFFYMFLIGFTPSVIRGSLLFIFLLMNKKLKLNLSTTTVLYILFLFLIIINPFYIYDLGFEYSFLTSFGLILFSKKITGNYFVKLIKISAIAFLFSFPITIYNFYEINLLTPLNNIIIVPLVSTILFPLTLITFILPIFDPLLYFGINILEWLSNFLNHFSINLIIPKISLLFIFIYYFIVYFIYKGKTKYIMFLILLTLSTKIQPYLKNESNIYFLDVGQGDCTVIVGSHLKYVVMIDTGGKISFEEEDWEVRNKTYTISNNVITFLKSLGITKIDTLIGTHGDRDHIGEMMNIINDFKVEKVILNNDELNDLESEIMEVLKAKKIKYIQNLKELNLDNHKLYFLNNKLYDNENDNSLVLYLNLSGLKILLMGDAGIGVESDLLNTYNLRDIDILKVGHHGSKTSSSKSFMNKINPTFSIISVGRNNRYNHPNQEVLENLEDSKIYRTDQDGSINFKINQGKLKIVTYPP